MLDNFGAMLKNTFKLNLAANASIKASNIRGRSRKKYGPHNLLDNDRYSYWATDDNVKMPWLIFDMHKVKTFDVIRLREDIKLGQRIDSAAIDSWQHGEWKKIATIRSIGGNRLIRLSNKVTTSKVRLRILKAGACVVLSDFGLYKEDKWVPPVLNKID
jgi:alpha-L-fucosidase